MVSMGLAPASLLTLRKAAPTFHLRLWPSLVALLLLLLLSLQLMQNALAATLSGTPGADVINGTPGADVINGRRGNDVINGGRGNDVINGGPGRDLAVFNGPSSSYSFEDDGGTLRVSGPAGVDRLTGVERLRFADRTVSIADVISPDPAPAPAPVRVSSTVGWQQTGLSLNRGNRFLISYVFGRWSVDSRTFPYVGPNGYSATIDRTIYQGCKYAPSHPYATLLGRIGNGSAFRVSSGGTFTADRRGTLSLRINDQDRCLVDNDGSVSVTVAASAACRDASGFSHPLEGQWRETQAFANYLSTYGGQTYNGYHPGDDFAFSGNTAGRPVYAIGAGKIAKISDLTGSGLGYLVAIEHNGSFTIPGKSDTVNGQMYTYNTEIVATIYSIYLHVAPTTQLAAGGCVEEGDQIATLASIGAPHLHFEIRHPSQTHDRGWSLVGSSNNWQTFPGTNTYNGYYINVQTMVDGGVRHPLEFLNANP
jgi:murein DD-endopeptidase MepM/ murein hydrolase activator NlpD